MSTHLSNIEGMEMAGKLPEVRLANTPFKVVSPFEPSGDQPEAIAALAAYLGLPMAQTMAIGDGLNDRSMIRMAGVGVAMANACPEILALADEVTASCDEDGAALAIERHCIPGKA